MSSVIFGYEFGTSDVYFCISSAFKTLCCDDTPMVRRAAAGKLGVRLHCLIMILRMFIVLFYSGCVTQHCDPGHVINVKK